MHITLFIFGSSGNLGQAFVDGILNSPHIDQIDKIYLFDFNHIAPNYQSDKCIFKCLDVNQSDLISDILDLASKCDDSRIVNFIAKDFPVKSSFDETFRSFGPSLSQLDSVFKTNISFPYCLSKLIVDYQIKNLRLIHIGSIYGLRIPHPSLYNDEEFINEKPSPYSISKAALLPLVKYSAFEFSKFESECFMVSLGGVFSDVHPSSFVAAYKHRTANLGLVNKKAVIDSLILFCICFPKKIANGSNFVLDNGYTIF